MELLTKEILSEVHPLYQNSLPENLAHITLDAVDLAV